MIMAPWVDTFSNLTLYRCRSSRRSAATAVSASIRASFPASRPSRGRSWKQSEAGATPKDAPRTSPSAPASMTIAETTSASRQFRSSCPIRSRHKSTRFPSLARAAPNSEDRWLDSAIAQCAPPARGRLKNAQRRSVASRVSLWTSFTRMGVAAYVVCASAPSSAGSLCFPNRIESTFVFIQGHAKGAAQFKKRCLVAAQTGTNA
jgi:hypothetical protein